MQILVIEDDPTLNGSLCHLLSRKGYTTVPAKSEQEARDVLKQHGGAIGIALVDMFLPVKVGSADDKESGLRLIQLMTQRYPSIVKVVYTGHGDVDNADKCMQAGAFSYCNKSSEPDDIVEKIKNAEVRYQREQSMRRGVRSLRQEVEEVQKRLTNLIGTIERLAEEVHEVPVDHKQSNATPEG